MTGSPHLVVESDSPPNESIQTIAHAEYYRHGLASASHTPAITPATSPYMRSTAVGSPVPQFHLHDHTASTPGSVQSPSDAINQPRGQYPFPHTAAEPRHYSTSPAPAAAAVAAAAAAAAPNENIQGGGRFRQIKSHDDHRSLELVEAWYTIVPAQLSSKLVNYIKDKLPEEVHSFAHLRRFVKIEHYDKSVGTDRPLTWLKVLLCSVETEPSRDELVSLVTEALASGDPHEAGIDAEQLAVVVGKAFVSRFQAYTKEQAAEWATRSWPILWRGNPSAIKTPLSDKEVHNSIAYLKVVSKLARAAAATSATAELPIATIIVDPVKDIIVAQHVDSRTSTGNVLKHSIMEAIAQAAQAEHDRRASVASRQTPDEEGDNAMPDAAAAGVDGLSGVGDDDDDRNYLCLNFHVYTTHEPCVMCGMALLHSRIGRLMYVQSSPLSGSIEPNSGSGTCVHWTRGLNWRYEAWRWIGGGEIDVATLPDSIQP